MCAPKSKIYEETLLADNKKEAILEAQDCNPYPKVIAAKWLYK
tara:strand:+ start:2588 stop:2716 length:129 start_codon:yes stop_codon:yes gene_type:complete